MTVLYCETIRSASACMSLAARACCAKPTAASTASTNSPVIRFARVIIL